MKLRQNIASCSSSYKYDNVIIMNRKETKFFDNFNNSELVDIFNATDSFARFHVRYITNPENEKYVIKNGPPERLAIYFDSDGFEFDDFKIAVKMMSA